MNRRGFTLLEFLVVLAMIGVLATLILAGLQSAREAAAAAECLSNLKQWGLALNLYAGDNDGFYPRRGQGVQPLFQIERPTDWFNALPPYMGSRSYAEIFAGGGRFHAGQHSVFVCPSAKDPGATHFLPYGMNMYLSPWNRPDPHRRQEIPDLAKLVFMADAPGQYSSTIPSRLPFSVLARHHGCANLCFADGHAAAFAGDYIGCGQGDPHRPDLFWETMTAGIDQAPLP